MTDNAAEAVAHPLAEAAEAAASQASVSCTSKVSSIEVDFLLRRLTATSEQHKSNTNNKQQQQKQPQGSALKYAT